MVQRIYETAQQFYDSLVEDATNGIFPSIAAEGNCRYRKDSTAECPQRCAVGKLIPNERYHPDLEGQTADTWKVREVFEDLLPDGITVADARLIQMAHDRTALDYDVTSYKYCVTWNPREFVKKLNRLECFRDCKQVDPNTLPTTLETAEAGS